MFRWLPNYMTTFNPFNRQINDVTFVAWLKTRDYLMTVSNIETWSSAVIIDVKPVNSQVQILQET